MPIRKSKTLKISLSGLYGKRRLDFVKTSKRGILENGFIDFSLEIKKWLGGVILKGERRLIHEIIEDVQ